MAYKRVMFIGGPWAGRIVEVLDGQPHITVNDPPFDITKMDLSGPPKACPSVTVVRYTVRMLNDFTGMAYYVATCDSNWMDELLRGYAESFTLKEKKDG